MNYMKVLKLVILTIILIGLLIAWLVHRLGVYSDILKAIEHGGAWKFEKIMEYIQK